MPRVQTAPDFPPADPDHSAAFSQAVSDKKYFSAMERCEVPYRHWDKIRRIFRDADLVPEALWAMVQWNRSLRRKRMVFTSVHGDPLEYLLTDSIHSELMLIDQQLAGRLTTDDETVPTGGQRERFIIDSLMEEAIASSQLEGASSVHRVAKEMLRRKRPPRDRSERMIVNNYRAMLFIRDHRTSPLSIDLLIDLQRILTKDTLDDPDQCGRLRHSGEIIVVEDPYGEELHMPPDASELNERLSLLCAFANDSSTDSTPFIHPVIRAMTLHFQLAYDHPFCDGNGRTARMLFYWSMLHQGYWLFEFLSISRLIKKSPSKYERAFLYVETDHFDLTYFLEYHTKIIARARKELRVYLANKQRETQAARRAFQMESVNDRQRALLMRALDNPNADYTIESHQTINGISYYAARSDLLGLEQQGFLAKRKESKKFVFSPTPLIRERVEDQ